MNKRHPVVLIVLDGWGHGKAGEHNAISQAYTPFYNSLIAKYPHMLLNASQEHVGLPQGTIGNSEIGHMTMGAGKVIDTDLVRISKAMQAGQFNINPAFLGLFEHVKKYNSTLHILGLLSAGGVHSHKDHLHGFLQAAKQADLKKVVIHAFTDGRDVAPKSAGSYLKELEHVIQDIGIGYIATASGRYFAMDRDNNWERTEKAEAAIFEGRGARRQNKTPSEAVEELYREGIIDEYLEPIIFLDDQGRAYKITNNDGIFFFNFRSDRPRQLSRKIIERSKSQNLYFVTLTEYDPTLESQVAFPPNKIEATLAAKISQAGLSQAHIAETEKYAHVTFFFNGGNQEPHKGEKHILIDSRHDIATHDLAPEMRAREIADKAIEALNDSTSFVLINFANADIVGHTANKPAIIKAVETIDAELKRLVEAALSKDGIILITADHGNAETNFDEQTGEKHTAHTLNLVPFILVSPLHPNPYTLTPTPGSLADIAPTILELMKIKKPSTMTGKSLLK